MNSEPYLHDPEFIRLINQWMEIEEYFLRSKRNLHSAQSAMEDATQQKARMDFDLREYANKHYKL